MCQSTLSKCINLSIIQWDLFHSLKSPIKPKIDDLVWFGNLRCWTNFFIYLVFQSDCHQFLFYLLIGPVNANMGILQSELSHLRTERLSTIVFYAFDYSNFILKDDQKLLSLKMKASCARFRSFSPI
jgi:hypothetical protein